MELMRGNGVQYALSQDPPHTVVSAVEVINKFKNYNEKTRPHIARNVEKESTTLKK